MVIEITIAIIAVVVMFVLEMFEHEYGHYKAFQMQGYQVKMKLGFKPRTSLSTEVMNEISVEGLIKTLRFGYFANLFDMIGFIILTLAFVLIEFARVAIGNESITDYTKKMELILILGFVSISICFVWWFVNMLPIGTNDGYKVKALKKLQRDYKAGKISDKQYAYGKFLQGLDKNGKIIVEDHDDYIIISPKHSKPDAIIRYENGIATLEEL